jgi:hypothetical protein
MEARDLYGEPKPFPMRSFTFLFFICFFLSCKKDSNPTINPPPPPPPGGPGGSGGSGSVNISSLSPIKVYQGDVITMTGTGFDPDKTKDTVLIGAVGGLSTGFTPRGTTTPFFPNPQTTIISATATEIKFTTDATVLFTENDPQLFAFQVSTPSGRHNTSDTLFIKALPRITRVTSYDPYTKPTCDLAKVFSGDSIVIEGVGFYPPLTVTIDDKAMDYLRFYNSLPDYNGNAPVTGFIGINYFGPTTPPVDQSCGSSKDYDKIIKVVNGDGKTAVFSTSFFAGPNTQILDCHMNKTSFSKKNDGSGLVTLSGYAVRDFTMTVTGTDPFSHAPFSETLGSNAGNLTGTFSQSIDFGTLPKPDPSGTDFQVTVTETNGEYIGGSVFTLYP